jgi:hypothetical protein
MYVTITIAKGFSINVCPKEHPPATQNFSVSFPITGKNFFSFAPTGFAHKEIMITLNYIIAK